MTKTKCSSTLYEVNELAGMLKGKLTEIPGFLICQFCVGQVQSDSLTSLCCATGNPLSAMDAGNRIGNRKESI